LPQARQFFDRWTAISPQVQYTAIQALGKEVEREFFASGRGFVINATTSDEDLNLQRLSRDLERYMIERLQARSDLNDAQRAKFMGISRNTYHRHRKKLLGL
jgi:transcriptional regulator with PAS, ATPase and Fis domain